MSETEQILDVFVETQGWSKNTIIDLALTYIDNQASPEAWKDYLTSLAEVDDDMSFEGDPDAKSEVKVSFAPQAWVNDYAIEVDAEGPREWYVTVATADDIANDPDGDLDFVREDERAPEWIKDWSGPFDIHVVCDRHGGDWGEDETCARCTYEDGTVRPLADMGPLGPGASV
jgi:hypothetical protein